MLVPILILVAVLGVIAYFAIKANSNKKLNPPTGNGGNTNPPDDEIKKWRYVGHSHTSSTSEIALESFNSSAEYFTELGADLNNHLTINEIVYSDELITSFNGNNEWIALSFGGLGEPQVVKIDINGKIIEII